jgi:ketosteroid isomerase-like protein
MSEDPVDVVRGAIGAWNRNDWEELTRLQDPDVTLEAPADWPESGTFQGRDDTNVQFDRLKDPWDEERIEVDDLQSRGEQVLVTVRWVTVGKASGITNEMPMCVLYTVNDGKMTRVRFTRNADEARVWFEEDR